MKEPIYNFFRYLKKKVVEILEKLTRIDKNITDIRNDINLIQ